MSLREKRVRRFLFLTFFVKGKMKLYNEEESIREVIGKELSYDSIRHDIVAIIPTYNEEESIREVIENCKKYLDRIIVIDDGSSDNTYEVITRAGVHPLRNNRNLGKGAALREGLREALDAEIFITMDGDGEHNPDDIPRLIEPLISNKADLVIGSLTDLLPLRRRFLYEAAALAVSLITGYRLRDVLSGFRAFNRSFLEEIMPFLTSNGYNIEVEEILLSRLLNMRVVNVPLSRFFPPRKSFSRIVTSYITKFFQIGVTIIKYLPYLLKIRPFKRKMVIEMKVHLQPVEGHGGSLAIPMSLDSFLEPVLDNSTLLTLNELTLIADILPLSSKIPEEYLERLQHRLEKDLKDKKEYYEREYSIHWDDFLNPSDIIDENELKFLPLPEKIKIYLRAEAALEYSLGKYLLEKELLEGQITYEEYESELKAIEHEVYSSLTGHVSLSEYESELKAIEEVLGYGVQDHGINNR